MREPYRVPVAEEDQRRADLVMQIVAVRLNTPIHAATRGARLPAAALRARRVSIYLVHIALGWQLERVAHAFGVSRQTASVAARRIEEARDEPNLDALLDELDEMIHAICDGPPADVTEAA